MYPYIQNFQLHFIVPIAENHTHFWIVLSLLLILIALVNAATASLLCSTEYTSAALSFGRRHCILSEVKDFFVHSSYCCCKACLYGDWPVVHFIWSNMHTSSRKHYYCMGKLQINFAIILCSCTLWLGGRSQ